MNVGFHGISQKQNQPSNLKAKTPQPATIVISTKSVQKSPNQHKHGCLNISSPCLYEFPYLYPPVKGSPKKTISTPNPWYFSKTTSPGSEILWKSKAQLRMNPITPWISRKWKGKDETIVNLGKSHANDNKRIM